MNQVLYETKKLKVSRILDNLESFGVEEVDELRKQYDSICNNFDDLNEKIKLLDEMEQSLDDYNERFKLLSKINFLDSAIEKVTDIEKLDECMEIAFSIINGYNKLKDKSKILNLQKMGSSIYKTIKKEILLNKNSQLLDKVKSDELLCYHIDNYIKIDVQNIFNSVNYNPIVDNIRTKINKINMNGLSSHLISYDLINLIVIFDNFTSKSKQYKSVLTNTKYGLANNFDMLNSFDGFEDVLKRAEHCDKEISSYEKKWSKNPFEIEDKVLNLVLSLLLFGGVAYAIPKVTRGLSNVNVYKTITERYIEGREVEVKEDYQEKNSREVTRTLEIGDEIYHTSVNRAYRSLIVYDLTDILLDSIEEYARLDLDEYGIRIYDYSRLYDVTLMEEGDKRVTIVTQDYSDSNKAYSSDIHVLICCICYVLEALCMIFPFSPLKTTMSLIKYKREHDSEVENYEDVFKKLLVDLQLLEEVIKNNGVIIGKYKDIKNDISDIYNFNSGDLPEDLKYIETMIEKNDEYYERISVLNKKWKKYFD